jgi:NAD+ kinase
MPPIRTLAFVLNPEKTGATELGRYLEEIARVHEVGVRTSTAFPVDDNHLAGCDACCVIGGDGTLLAVVHAAAQHQVPVIGVNRGSLGFLTTFSADEARAHFTALLRGEFTVEPRSLLECSTGPGQHGLALNDVLIKSEVNSRLAVLEVFADGQLVTEYHCDGLIFSTPTGSTAYNLSAGGPLVHPSARVVAMTPICPHTLSNRSIIFREDVRLQVYNRGGPARLVVAADGQRHLVSCETSPVEISIARKTLPLAHLPGYDHFSVLRTKLRWSGGYAERPR